MKKILFIGMVLIGIIGLSSFIKSDDSNGPKPAKSIYDFKIESIDGGKIDFSEYKGKYILIVNTASKCGYTPQYKGLEQLYKDYGDKLVVVGFPSDNFADQEFHDNVEIKSFCEKNYGVTFPLTTSVDVKGSKITPVFDYLTHKSQNGVMDATISWNFNKFLISPEGKLLEHFDSKVVPESEKITHYFK
ncbi:MULTISPECIES: glutathione peroxidase [unclassified Chryseobacterium]|jgi:glutathione peroxidase|uniref:glutathione peroxidase n=1 Tax=unclassified Chryseobacterium TaxID=2593645 RepID=UPI0009545A48|nr:MULTISPECIES: glutathione peroxidase [unclassified Chryseobacterium]PXW18250.1 glutathione peroxidase [Chryseobacterium sp. CBTAP 102]SIR52084.1 glutathione peroxidase [Chryseobacterium sp. RU33C]